MVLENIENIITTLPRSTVNITEVMNQTTQLHDALQNAKIQDIYDLLRQR